MVVAKTVFASISNAYSIQSLPKLPLFRPLLCTVLAQEPLLPVSLMAALVKMDNNLTPVKENSQCSTAPTASP